ncbi:MAG: hypothetical protein EOO65_04640 [Methanosarcinales archaeon]|nr:MAG: hypothetical protein EOO65_04640 [Methanosarcinales archaeon]
MGRTGRGVHKRMLHACEQHSIRVARMRYGARVQDVGSKTDAFVEMYVKGRTGAWEKVGQSETVFDNQNPAWTRQFMVDFRFEEVQPVKFVVWDFDSVSAHDYIGEVRAMFCSGSCACACVRDAHTPAHPTTSLIDAVRDNTGPHHGLAWLHSSFAHGVRARCVQARTGHARHSWLGGEGRVRRSAHCVSVHKAGQEGFVLVGPIPVHQPCAARRYAHEGVGEHGDQEGFEPRVAARGHLITGAFYPRHRHPCRYTIQWTWLLPPVLYTCASIHTRVCLLPRGLLAHRTCCSVCVMATRARHS